MKKILSLLVVAVLMLGMMSVSVSANGLGKVYHAPFATPVVDGVMEDAWTTAEWTNVDVPFDGSMDTVCSARVRVMHDSELLYFFVEMTDATPDAVDKFEIYFDEDNCDDVAYCENTYQIQVAIDGTITGGTNSPDAFEYITASAIAQNDSGYVFEFAMKPINGVPAADKVIGMEFMYSDAIDGAADQEALRWNADTANGDTPPWQGPEAFGDLICDEYVEPVVEDVPADEAPAEGTAAPSTADAGIVVAAVVMAAAAAVVCKKH